MNNGVMVLGWLLMSLGLLFLFAGAVGLLRLPDLFSRLHAVTKADTVGLGLLSAGLACHAEGMQARLVLLLVWLFVMASGAIACQLLARYATRGTSNALLEQRGSNDQR